MTVNNRHFRGWMFMGNYDSALRETSCFRLLFRKPTFWAKSANLVAQDLKKIRFEFWFRFNFHCKPPLFASTSMVNSVSMLICKLPNLIKTGTQHENEAGVQMTPVGKCSTTQFLFICQPGELQSCTDCRRIFSHKRLQLLLLCF